MLTFKKNLLILSVFLLFFVLFTPSEKEVKINTDIAMNHEYDNILLEEVPIFADGQDSYTYNPRMIISETFSSSGDINDWIIYEANGGDVRVTSGTLQFLGETDGGLEWTAERAGARYDMDIPQFYKGNISFDYQISESNEVNFLFYIWDGAGHQIDSWNAAESGSYEFELTGTNYDSRDPSFTIQFNFTGRVAGDSVEIDNFQVHTWEFVWEELTGDPIEQNQNQNFRAYFVPSFSNFNRTNATLIYDLNDDTLSNPSEVIMTDGGPENFHTCTITHGNYESSDRINYKIVINNDARTTYQSSLVESFDCYDRTNPTITYQGNNATNYYNDVLIRCHIIDDLYGDGLDLVRLYINNGSAADTGDVLIPHNISDVDDGGNFGFIVNSSFLSARDGEELHFRVYARDNNNNEEVSSDYFFSLDDDIAPMVSPLDNNSLSGNQIECATTFKINYTITEPDAGSGLNIVKLLVYISDKAPQSNGNFNFTFNPLEYNGLGGGVFNFEIPAIYYRYRKNLYCFINATDQSGNNYTQFSNYLEFSIVDISAPDVSDDPNNNEAKSYHLDNYYLNFTLYEPPAGSGIMNSTILYYSLNSNMLNNETFKLDVAKYGQIATYTIPNGGWKYGNIIYYRINVTDNEGHTYLSSTQNFEITDSVKPHYNEEPRNTNGWVYNNFKFLNFTVFDPDYDGAIANSSGINNITLYWKAGSAPTTSDYHGMLIYDEAIMQLIATYSFNLSLTGSMYNNGPRIYYIINVSDDAGNYNISTERYFYLYPSPYISETILQPDAVIGTSDFIVSFDLYFYCDFSYYIDNIFQELRIYKNSFSKNFNLPEGEHQIIFNFTKANTKYIINVEIDLTPPDKVEDIAFELFGYEVIELNWDIPSGVDSETIYKIYRSTDPNFKMGSDTFLTKISAGEATSYEDTDIRDGTTYYYIIVAIDRVGNVSEESDVIEVEVPANPTVMIIVIVAISAALGITGYMVYKKVTANKRDRIFSQVDLKELDLADHELTTNAGPDWKQIKTTAEPKIIQEEGFEFASDQPLQPLYGESYWEQNIGILFGKSAEFELNNELGIAIRGYTLLSRLAQIQDNSFLANRLKSKIRGIFQRLND